MPRIDAFLQLGREQGCSDIHFTVGLPPLVRMDGELTPIKYRDLSEQELRGVIAEVATEAQWRDYERTGAVDFAYTAPDVGRIRINVCRQVNGLTAVCRIVPSEVPGLADLRLPPVIGTLTDLNAGLILVTGATGTGKSTTLAAFINEINKTRNSMIITLEDPIEFVHTSNESLVVQREIGVHVRDYAEGLRAALRQDPDVIVVGELRDRESITLALEAAETGHLVLGTLHTRSAAKTVDRILDALPTDEHAHVRSTLADNLKCVVSQELVRVADGRGRRAAVEIMLMTPALAQHIREGRNHQISQTIATGKRHGMQLMDAALLGLVQAGEIDPDAAYRLAASKADFAPYCRTAAPVVDRPAPRTPAPSSVSAPRTPAPSSVSAPRTPAPSSVSAPRTPPPSSVSGARS
jgi:twitching motility protein PilT